MKICIRLLCGNEPGGWINPALFAGLSGNLSTFNARRHAVQLGLLVGLMPVAYARNRAVIDALESGADWLLMVDNDQVLPDNLALLFEEANVTSHVNIISIATWMMRRGPSPTLMVNNMPIQGVESGRRIESGVWNMWQEKWARLITAPANGFEELQSGGAGVLLIRRKVLETLKAPWFHMVLDPTTGEGQGGEDDYFCERAAKAGFKIHAHRGFTCGHLKTVDLRGFAAT